MAKKKVIHNIKDVIELEVIDNKFFILKHFADDTKYGHIKFVFEPKAQIIGLGGFNMFEYFIVKEDGGIWVISESISGSIMYKSADSETKSDAVKKCIAKIKKKLKTEEGLINKVNEIINKTGMISPRFRS